MNPNYICIAVLVFSCITFLIVIFKFIRVPTPVRFSALIGIILNTIPFILDEFLFQEVYQAIVNRLHAVSAFLCIVTTVLAMIKTGQKLNEKSYRPLLRLSYIKLAFYVSLNIATLVLMYTNVVNLSQSYQLVLGGRLCGMTTLMVSIVYAFIRPWKNVIPSEERKRDFNNLIPPSEKSRKKVQLVARWYMAIALTSTLIYLFVCAILASINNPIDQWSLLNHLDAFLIDGLTLVLTSKPPESLISKIMAKQPEEPEHASKRASEDSLTKAESDHQLGVPENETAGEVSIPHMSKRPEDVIIEMTTDKLDEISNAGRENEV